MHDPVFWPSSWRKKILLVFNLNIMKIIFQWVNFIILPLKRYGFCRGLPVVTLERIPGVLLQDNEKPCRFLISVTIISGTLIATPLNVQNILRILGTITLNYYTIEANSQKHLQEISYKSWDKVFLFFFVLIDEFSSRSVIITNTFLMHCWRFLWRSSHYFNNFVGEATP